MNYWLQRDAHSPAEGPFPKAEILLMLKRRVIDPSAVVNEPGQPSWQRAGDVFARELRKWRWERFMVKWGIIGGVMAALALMVLMKTRAAAERDLEKERLEEVERERRMAYAQSPEGKAEAEHQRKRMIAYWKTPEGKEARRKYEESVKQANEAAYQQQAAAARSVSAIEPSAWDGSVSEAKRFIERAVRDPSAIKYNQWKNFTNEGRHITTVDFTATNGFGGPSRETWVFSFDRRSGKLMYVSSGDKTLYDAEP